MLTALLIGILLAMFARWFRDWPLHQETREYWERTARLAARAVVAARKCHQSYVQVNDLHDCIKTDPAVRELTDRIYGRKAG